MRLLYRRKYTVPYSRLITNFLKSIIASFALVIFTFPRWLHVFARFPLPCTASPFSRALQWLYVFAAFALATRFSTFCIGSTFSRALNRLHAFPRFALLVTFSRLEAEIKLWLGFDWLIAQRKSLGFDSRHVLCTCNAMWYLQLALMNSL